MGRYRRYLRRLAAQELSERGWPVDEIALVLGVTPRHVRRMSRRVRLAEVLDRPDNVAESLSPSDEHISLN